MTPDRIAAEAWHAVAPAAAVERLGADPHAGLAAAEVERRRRRFGANVLPRRRRNTILRVFLRQFQDPLIYVLVIAGAISLAIGNMADALFIFAVLVINAGLGTYQEYRAETAAQALESVMKVAAKVIRDGDDDEIDSAELVPGDIVRVASGDAVPADIRLLHCRDLRTDESLLTGESTPVEKDADAEVAEDAPTGDRRTLLHAGTTVSTGRGYGVVVRTGALTEVGRIAGSLAAEEQVPPLVVRMRRFTRTIAVAVVGFIVVLGAAQAARGQELVDLFFLAVALAVSAIPAGLPVAITVALAVGSARMARRNVIVRRLPAVEGLGACTLIATDKTGTLTENKLTVTRIRPVDGDDVEVTGTGYAADGRLVRGGEAVDPGREGWLRAFIVTGALCNEARASRVDGELRARGDTVDIAFLVLAHKAGLSRRELLAQHEQVGEIPFESERRFSATFHRHGDRVVAHVKGAAETLAGMCDVDPDTVHARAEALAEAGYRVLALACGEVSAAAAAKGDAGALKGLSFLGLAGLIDPVREAVPDALTRCRSAGIDVRMVTGDHPATASAIGRRLGIAAEGEKPVNGREIARAREDDARLDRRIRDTHIYSRVEPLQKVRIVKALQDAGHFVAVTGDGVNDAPALRDAHIGVAMGRDGTDVARNASDLILTDDNFASIVSGVEEGRIAYDNVRKVIWLLISTGVAELVLFTLAVAFDTPLPLTPVQLLWLNLVTNGIQDVALALEAGEPGVLRRRPRRPQERIFNRLMIEEVVTSGLYMGVVVFAVFYVLLEILGLSVFDARNHLVLLLVLFENVHAFNVRSETRSAFRIPIGANPVLVFSVVIAQGVHIASMFVPGWREVLEIEPVSFATWVTLLAITLSKFLVVELYKGLRGRELAARTYGRSAAELA